MRRIRLANALFVAVLLVLGTAAFACDSDDDPTSDTTLPDQAAGDTSPSDSSAQPDAAPDAVAGPQVLASDYNQACVYDGECLPINEGAVCDCHVCPTAAIHGGDVATFDADWTAGLATCPELTCPTIGCGETYLGYCDAGQCSLRAAQLINIDDYDTSCSVDADCVGIAAGEICAPCQECHNGAINVASVGAYEADRQAVECHSEPIDCGCATTNIVCNMGVCEVESQ